MCVIPESHKLGIFDHGAGVGKRTALNAVIDCAELDRSAAVDIMLEPGQKSLHDAM